jgi:hypothetical protein
MLCCFVMFACLWRCAAAIPWPTGEKGILFSLRKQAAVEAYAVCGCFAVLCHFVLLLACGGMLRPFLAPVGDKGILLSLLKQTTLLS